MCVWSTVYTYIWSLTVRNVCYLSAGCCDAVRDRFARSVNAPTTPTVGPHCPRVPSRANVCLLPTHRRAHTPATLAQIIIYHYIYARSAAGTYICTIILNIIMRSYSRRRNSPRPSRPPPISRVADLAFWRALSLCPCGDFKEILQPSKGGPVRFSETFCGRNG